MNDNSNKNIDTNELKDQIKCESENSSNDKPKSLVEEIKELGNVLEALATIGSAIVLILSTIKIVSYSHFYGIPIFDLSTLSVLYSVLIYTIFIGIAGFLLYCNYVFFKQKITGNITSQLGDNVLMSAFFLASTGIVFLTECQYFKYAFSNGVMEFIYGFISVNVETQMFLDKWLIYIIITILAGIPLLFYCLISIRFYWISGTNNKCSKMKKEKKNTAKKKENSVRNIVAVQGLLNCISIIIFFEIVLLAFGILFRKDLIPSNNKEQEIIEIGSQLYATVSNNNGKLVVKCDEFDSYGKKSLVIYKNEYKYIDPQEFTFNKKTYDKIVNSSDWYTPDYNKEESHNVLVELSDVVAGKCRLKSDFFDWFYVEITNNDSEDVTIGSYYNLEIFEYDKWRFYSSEKPVKSFVDPCVLSVGGSTRDYCYDLSVFGELKPGHYRIACCDDGSGTKNHYVEFTLRSNGEIIPI